MICATLFLWGFLFLSAGDARDACTYLASLNITSDYHIEDIPYCNYADECTGITSLTSRETISCGGAYQVVARRIARRTFVPPIVETICPNVENTLYQKEEDYENSFLRKISPPSADCPIGAMLIRLERSADQIRNRIIEMNYRFLYDEDIDGPLLREFINASREITNEEFCECRDFVRTSTSYRNLGRQISHILHFLASRRIPETESAIGSFAPWMHAFLHSLYITQIVFPGMLTTYGFAIRIFVTYHPLYTRDDDGIWYLYLDSEFAENLLLEPLYQRNEELTWEDVEEIFDEPIPPRDARSVVKMLEEQSNIYFETKTFEDTLNAIGRIERIIYALEYLSMYENVAVYASPALIELVLKLIRGEHSLGIVLNPVIGEYLNRIFQTVLPLQSRALLLAQLSHYNYKPVMQKIASERSITHWIRSDKFRLDEIVDSLMVQQDALFGELGWDVHAVQGGHIPETDECIQEIMDLFFSSSDGGLFQVQRERAADLLNGTSLYYKINPAVAEAHINEQIALGRFLGILLSLDLLHIVTYTHMFAPRANASIFETVFFNSRYIRQGFYNVYLEGVLEDVFSDGQEFIDGIQLRGQAADADADADYSSDSQDEI